MPKHDSPAPVTDAVRAQAQARGEAEAAAVGVSLAGVQHPCMLGACAPEEIATLTQQVGLLSNKYVPSGSRDLRTY